ncbi:BTAD domain-containing putative transcriptional regulator [Streptomyces sp. NPDC059853]|uniref:AfsR/SARP family transcriptional regulator n=1 Tax=Streptomyces sp. NPDC059853 TaxID=3346973 RepID=UPI003661E38B
MVEVDLQVSMLGPLAVRRSGRDLHLGPPLRRVLLIRLLLENSRSVPVDVLCEDVWQGRPPPSAVATLYAHVSRLRDVLEPPRSRRTDHTVLARESTGYALLLPENVRDTARFERLVVDARQLLAEGRATDARAEVDRALALWRGTALADVEHHGFAMRESARLTELRLQAVELRTDALLHEGEFEQAVLVAEDLTARHPLRERAWNLLLRSLYLSGRPADALRRFDDIRRRLGEELGVDPGPELRGTHQAILEHDLRLPHPAPGKPSWAASPRPAGRIPRRGPLEVISRPAQLPAGLSTFVGRSAELAELRACVDEEQAGTTPRAVLIDGAAGTGKTALAVHWSHRAADTFPDGQLFVNLRGYDQSGRPLDPADALEDFLGAFEVPPARVPAGLDAKIAMFRSLLARRRVLVVLDNGLDESQLRPLLPSTPGSMALVTSRAQLPGLIVTHDVRPLTLGAFSPEEARQALARRLGADQTDAHPEAVRDIIDLCGRLPLALAIVATVAQTRPNHALPHIADELHRTRGSLDLFTGADAHTDLRTVLSWSYRVLSPDAARLFRLLSLSGTAWISARAAASLAGLTMAQVQPLLMELTRQHLVSVQRPDRYVLSGLIRAYAAELTLRHDSHADRRAARTRLTRYPGTFPPATGQLDTGT